MIHHPFILPPSALILYPWSQPHEDCRWRSTEVSKVLRLQDPFPRAPGLGQHQAHLDIPVDGNTVSLTAIAQKRGFVDLVFYHRILNLYEEGELHPKATHKEFLSVRQEGSRQVRSVVKEFLAPRADRNPMRATA